MIERKGRRAKETVQTRQLQGMSLCQEIQDFQVHTQTMHLLLPYPNVGLEAM